MRPPTVTDWPVRGFFIARGLRRATEKVPKQTSGTESPRLSDALIPASMARTARSVEALGQPAAAAIRTTRSALVIALHTERGARLVHHRGRDGGEAALRREALDRPPRHRADERGDALDTRLGVRRPHDRRRGPAALVARGGERTAGAGGVAPAARAPFERVGPHVRHRAPHVLERRRGRRAPADLHAEAPDHLRLERVDPAGHDIAFVCLIPVVLK